MRRACSTLVNLVGAEELEGKSILANWQKILGNNNLVIGDHNTIYGNGNRVIGNSNRVNGNYNWCTGKWNEMFGHGNRYDGSVWQNHELEKPAQDLSKKSPSVETGFSFAAIKQKMLGWVL